MKCIKCNHEIEELDNFCSNCGHWTAKGYSFFHDNPNHIKMLNGSALKLENKVTTLFALISLLTCLILIITFLRGQMILKPFIYLKKEFNNHKYGYQTSVIKTNNEYNNLKINNLEEANIQIEKDLFSQKWQCTDNIDIHNIEENLKKKYNIKEISFCDMELERVKIIESTIDKFFTIFPKTEGYLDIITITNSKKKDDYVAYFQPIYQFINRNSDINKYNKVNKSQLLLNSYYFLNNDILSKNVNNIVKENFYVKNATWESLIAHELGHYITYVALLKQEGITNLTLTTKENETKLYNIIDIINNNTFSESIINESLINYNNLYHDNLDINTFTKNISEYANIKDKNGKIITDETIAEAVHDYYLHNSNASKYSIEIIKVLKTRLGDNT